ncbi:hypothetical protein BMS3Abin17_00678 [archaeon BMS3Abin17]|nr:hypothetical protein BMS3Abin17_00678 [archaeon BMS3Abin17]
MAIKKILLILLCLTLIQSISAYTYLNIYVEETGEALFLGETNEQLSLPEGVEISKEEVKGTTQELTSKTGEVWSFSYSLNGAELYVILPKGAVIKNLNNGEISLEKEQFSIYAKESVEVEYTIEPVGESYLYIAIIVLIALIIFYIIKKKKTKSKKGNNPDKIKIVEGLLNDREKLIISEVKKAGKIKNSQLRKRCDIPKASFSRHLQELEKKNLIKRDGEGKNKIVSLG